MQCTLSTSRLIRFGPSTAFAILLVAPREVLSQPSVAADVGVFSQFIWRGVTSTNRPVLQPEVMVTTPVGGMSLLLGLWGNIEPVRYDGPRELSSLGGLPGPFITQSQAWVEMSGTVARRFDASAGVQAYFYPHIANLSDFNTAEVYASLTANVPLTPSVTVNYDVARIRGAYLEGGVSQGLTGERLGELTVSLIAGFSAGQAVDSTGRDLAYFERDGLSHVDASASATFALGPVSIAPEAHFILARDAWAKVVEPDVSRGAKLWVGTTLSWSSARDSR